MNIRPGIVGPIVGHMNPTNDISAKFYKIECPNPKATVDLC